MPSMKSVGTRQRGRNVARSRKHSAWKKSRQFGDSYGLAAFSRVQRIYIPYTHLPSPLPGVDGPQLIENKPHKDFFFPVTGQEVLGRIGQLPESHTEGLTHVWLRHQHRNQSRDCFGSYCTGPGYRAIVLNPWPQSLRWELGPQLDDGWKKLAHMYNATLKRSRGCWQATFSLEESRRFYLDDLILREVGHHVDDRWRSKANRKPLEDFADQYAVKWARLLNEKTPGRRRFPGMTRAAYTHLKGLIQVAFPKWTARFGSSEVAPLSKPTVSFHLVDRNGCAKSKPVWIAATAVATLTVSGLKARVRRANLGRDVIANQGRVR